ASNGVTFTRAFTVNPLCCPSRVSLLTGKYSHSTGVYNNSGRHGSWSDFHDATTLATVLHERGYTTALIGKYVNTYGQNSGQRGYIPPGWDRWLAFLGGTKYYDYNLADQRKVVHHGHSPSDYSTTVFTRAAVEFIRTAPRPFFLLLAPFAPHEPAIAPPGMEDSFADLPWWKPPSYNEQDRSDKPAYVRNLPPLTSRQMRRTVE